MASNPISTLALPLLHHAWLTLTAPGKRGRSLLTLTSIAIGTFCIILLTSLAQSGLHTMIAGFEKIGGAHLLFVFPDFKEAKPKSRFYYDKGITMEDRDAVALLPGIETISLYATEWKKSIVDGRGVLHDADYVFADPALLDLHRFPMAAGGRSLSVEDSRDHRRVAVIGPEIAEKIKQSIGASPVGARVRIHNQSYEIIGVLETSSKNANFGFRPGGSVIIPLTTAESMFKKKSWRQMLIRTTTIEDKDLTKGFIAATLRERHAGFDDFLIFDALTALRRLEEVFLIVKAIVLLIAAVALLVGGVGVMNMMLVSVSEKTREIGIRRASGASRGGIFLQFLIESTLLSTSGGVIGALTGLAATSGANLLLRRFTAEWQGSFSGGALLAGILSSLLFGLCFGLLPAIRASRLRTVDCLRSL